MQVDRVLVGGGGAISSCQFFSKSITPAAMAAAIGTSEQTFATIGAPQDLLLTDQVLLLTPPGAGGTNVMAISARVTAVQTIGITFGNFTAVANVPTAGVYGFLVFRV